MKAVEAGYSVLFLTLEGLMTRLVRAKHENRLERALQQLTYPKVLILDELGYLPLSREEASLFFRLVVRRYERASLIVTSNKSFVDWGEVFNDQVLATQVRGRGNYSPYRVIGERCSMTRCWRLRSSTGCCTTPRRSTSRARATD